MKDIQVIEEIELIGSKFSYYCDFERTNSKIDFLNKLDACMINGKWGSGKSVFIDKIRKLGEKKGIKILVVDAWKYEYLQNPERMIMVESLKNLEIKPEKELLKFAGSNLLKSLDEELSRLSNGDNTRDRVIKTFYKTARNMSNESVYKEQLKKFDELAFSYLDEEMLKYMGVDIIIFDELDRVLPETFIEIIKFIKYFGDDLTEIKMSATLNLVQCNAMIKRAYGEHFSSSVYLDKIFKKTINIENYSAEKGEYIYSQFLRLNGYENESDANITFAEYICSHFKYSAQNITKENFIVGFGFDDLELRQVEHLMINDLKDFNQLVNHRTKQAFSEYDRILYDLLLTIFYIHRTSFHEPTLYEEIMSLVENTPDNEVLRFDTNIYDIPCALNLEQRVAILNAMRAKRENKFISWLSNLDINVEDQR